MAESRDPQRRYEEGAGHRFDESSEGYDRSRGDRGWMADREGHRQQPRPHGGPSDAYAGQHDDPMRGYGFGEHERTGFGHDDRGWGGMPHPHAHSRYGGPSGFGEGGGQQFGGQTGYSQMGGYAGVGQQGGGQGGWDQQRGWDSRGSGQQGVRGWDQPGGSWTQSGSGNFGPTSGAQQPRTFRGPRNYTRSDERVREDVCDAIIRAAEVDAGEVDVTVQNGEVTLSGTVDSRRDKRRLEDIIESVDGVKDVHNQVRVRSAGGLGGAVSRAAEAVKDFVSGEHRDEPGGEKATSASDKPRPRA